MGGSNPNAGGQRRMCGPFLVAGAALHGSVILERVETECWGVNAECVVHASWRGRRSTVHDVLWCFAVCIGPLQRHGSIYLVYVTGVPP